MTTCILDHLSLQIDDLLRNSLSSLRTRTGPSSQDRTPASARSTVVESLLAVISSESGVLQVTSSSKPENDRKLECGPII